MAEPSNNAPAEGPNVQPFLDEIARYDDRFKQWTGRVEKLLKRYKDDTTDDIRTDDATVKFNILWSNVQTLSAATFAKLPQADVRRRFQDQDPVGRVAALILERALTYELEQYTDYAATLRNAITDRFLGGRGTAWVRYEPHMRAIQAGEPTDGVQVTEDQDEPGEEIDYECAPTDYVLWRDFGHNVARTWEEVYLVWRRVYMYRPDVEKRFGPELAAKVAYDADPEKDPKTYEGPQGRRDQALIYEIWDKRDKTVRWMNKSVSEFLDSRPDPLGLHDFFPCPKPLYATLTTESLVPLPDFTLYQDQAMELDLLADRIDGLVKALQIRGTYDSSITALGRLFDEVNTNALVPVDNWHQFAEKGGLKGALDLVEIEPIAQCLQHSYMAMEQIKGQVYEITGISDIIRGQTVASETATAQQLKGQYASLRLKAYQDEVSRFATEMLRLKAQIICGKFAPDTILQMSAAEQLNPADQQFIQPAMELLLGPRLLDPAKGDSPNPLRNFRIDVAADSMVYLDEQEEKDNRVEFLTACGQFIGMAEKTAQSMPDLMPMMLEFIKFGASGFKAARSVEGVIDQTIAGVQEKMANPEPQPDPEQQKAEHEAAMEQQKLQFEGQMEQQRLGLEQQAEQMRLQMEAQAKEKELMLEAKVAQMEQQIEAERAEREMEFQRWKAQLDAQTKIEVAQIGASAKAAMTAQAGEGEEVEDEDGEQEPEGPSETQQMLSTLNTLVERLTQPRSVVRGPDGRIAGIQ